MFERFHGDPKLGPHDAESVCLIAVVFPSCGIHTNWKYTHTVYISLLLYAEYVYSTGVYVLERFFKF